jgi:hypothetical protein
MDANLKNRWLGLGMVAAAILVFGCGRAPNAEEGVKSLEQTFANPAAVPAIELAIAAVKTNDLGQGVVALQSAKQVPGLSPEQLQTVEETAQTLTQELLRRADAGDARAKADLELIERSRSQ